MLRGQIIARAGSTSGKSWRSWAASKAGGVVSTFAAPMLHGVSSACADAGITTRSSAAASQIPPLAPIPAASLPPAGRLGLPGSSRTRRRAGARPRGSRAPRAWPSSRAGSRAVPTGGPTEAAGAARTRPARRAAGLAMPPNPPGSSSTTGMRSWIGRATAFASPVTIVQLGMTAPSAALQLVHRPAKKNGSSLSSEKCSGRRGCFGSSGFCHSYQPSASTRQRCPAWRTRLR